jgi:hypothetical protein
VFAPLSGANTAQAKSVVPAVDFAACIPPWLDAFLIAPFRWPPGAHAGMWLGSAFLGFYCLLLGECTAAALYLLHHKYYDVDDGAMMRYHKVSMDALKAGNKDAYLAANTLAREHFGKSFFAGAALGLSSLWPVPFALGWMSLRFEGIVLYTVPVLGHGAGHVFVLLTLYIALRLCFGRVKQFLPLFRQVEKLRREARATARPR